MDPNVKERIDRDVKSNRVFLYMKGTPAFPQCGFSQRVVQILRHYGVELIDQSTLECVRCDLSRSRHRVVAPPHGVGHSELRPG